MNPKPIGHREKIAAARDVPTLNNLLAEFEKFKYASEKTKRAVALTYKIRMKQLT